MKTFTKNLIVLALVLCLGTTFRVAGQGLLAPNGKYGPRLHTEERGIYHVYLEPQQELETVDVIEGCMTFLTEVRFSVPLPFGESVAILFPPGSSWPIPAGRYKLDNPTQAPIEYVLKTSSTCSSTSPKKASRVSLWNPEANFTAFPQLP